MDVILSEFSGVVDILAGEWNGTEHMTCEFSTSEEFLAEKKKILQASSRSLGDAMWIMGRCSTCEGHRSTRPIHVQIVVGLKPIEEDE